MILIFAFLGEVPHNMAQSLHVLLSFMPPDVLFELVFTLYAL